MIGFMHVGPQGRRMGETIIGSNGNRGGLISIHLLLLHPSPGYVTSDPRGNILAKFDHDEENDPVYDYHAEDYTQINPLWSVYINLENILQYVFAWDF